MLSELIGNTTRIKLVMLSGLNNATLFIRSLYNETFTIV